MATVRDLPADVAAALDRYPAARDAFAAMSAERQAEWLAWIDEARGPDARAARIDEAVRRLSPGVESREEVIEPVAPPPERGWWLWLALLLVLVVAGLLAWFFLTRGSGKTTVPDVVGLPSSVAASRLQAAHLKDLPKTGASSRPQGTVFAQAPGAGVRVKKNGTVTISISSGPAHVAVPNVTDLPQAQAVKSLTAAGFKSNVVKHASSRPKGIVFAQQPVAGVTAVKGTRVVLSVSTGVKPVTVPSVVGETQGAAVAALTSAGLKSQLANVPSSAPVGQIVAQKPAGGAKVDKASTVRLNVSTGSGGGATTTGSGGATSTATVPTITGQQQTPALRRLNALGFRPVVRYVASSRPANTITTQHPAAGTTLRRGSRVVVTVSEGTSPNAPATVPDVVGQDQSSAVGALRSAGFTVLVLRRPTTDPSQDGNVVDEQPVAGSSIPSGSQVTIFVGRLSSG